MASIAGAVISQKYDLVNYNQGTAYVGFNYGKVHYPLILQFKTPSFTGQTTSLDFNLSMSDGNRNEERSSKVNLRYAILSSDANYSKYFTTAAVTDENQLTSGTLTISELVSQWESKKINIAVAGLAADTTYYLVLWGDNSGGYGQDYAVVNTPANHSITLDYVPTYTVWTKHYLKNADGSYTCFAEKSEPVAENADHTPQAVALPSGNVMNTAECSGYSYYTENYGACLGRDRVTGVDAFAVTQNVIVEVIYPLCAFKLSISVGKGTTVSVMRNGAELKSGADVLLGDVLTVEFGTAEGYTLTAHTVNGAEFASGESHTVAGAVAVAAEAFLRAYPIGSKLYHACIGGKLYTAYIGGADGKPVPYGVVQ